MPMTDCHRGVDAAMMLLEHNWCDAYYKEGNEYVGGVAIGYLNGP